MNPRRSNCRTQSVFHALQYSSQATFTVDKVSDGSERNLYHTVIIIFTSVYSGVKCEWFTLSGVIELIYYTTLIQITENIFTTYYLASSDNCPAELTLSYTTLHARAHWTSSGCEDTYIGPRGYEDRKRSFVGLSLELLTLCCWRILCGKRHR